MPQYYMIWRIVINEKRSNMVSIFLFAYIITGIFFHMYIERIMGEIDLEGFINTMFDEDDPIRKNRFQ